MWSMCTSVAEVRQWCDIREKHCDTRTTYVSFLLVQLGCYKSSIFHRKSLFPHYLTTTVAHDKKLSFLRTTKKLCQEGLTSNYLIRNEFSKTAREPDSVWDHTLPLKRQQYKTDSCDRAWVMVAAGHLGHIGLTRSLYIGSGLIVKFVGFSWHSFTYWGFTSPTLNIICMPWTLFHGPGSLCHSPCRALPEEFNHISCITGFNIVAPEMRLLGRGQNMR